MAETLPGDRRRTQGVLALTFASSVRVARHFVRTRALEVLALQASPVLGAVLGGLTFHRGDLRPVFLLLGSLALTFHVFVLNDWAGHSSDVLASRRATEVFTRQGIERHQVAWLAIALLLFANLAFAAVGTAAVLLAVGIAVLSLVYSCAPAFGKNTPIAASLNHILGGALHFMLGYTLSHPVDWRGVWLGLFFGLVFAAGHLNQEVRDYEDDLLNGIRTSASVFGPLPTFLASLCLFTVAYALLVGLAVRGMLPERLVYSVLLWILQVVWSVQALRKGLGFETAVWMQRRYRVLFALIGLAMLN